MISPADAGSHCPPWWRHCPPSRNHPSYTELRHQVWKGTVVRTTPNPRYITAPSHSPLTVRNTASMPRVPH